MKINKKQVIFIYNQEEFVARVNEIVNTIEKLFSSYYDMSKYERFSLLKVFYDFDFEKEDKTIDEIIDYFDSTHSLIDVYQDIKGYLAIFIYEINRNANTTEEEDISLKLKYYYNTTFKQKQRMIE